MYLSVELVSSLFKQYATLCFVSFFHRTLARSLLLFIMLRVDVLDCWRIVRTGTSHFGYEEGWIEMVWTWVTRR